MGAKRGCWKKEVTTTTKKEVTAEERARKTGQEGRERGQAGERGRREGERGVVPDGKGRGWSQGGTPVTWEKGRGLGGGRGRGKGRGGQERGEEQRGGREGEGQRAGGAGLGETGSQGAGQRARAVWRGAEPRGRGPASLFVFSFLFSGGGGRSVTVLLPSGSLGAVAAGHQPDPRPANPPV